jgi:hypothetical protein
MDGLAHRKHKAVIMNPTANNFDPNFDFTFMAIPPF